MTSYERRIIHMTLREDRRVVTGSEGDEPFRSVVVSPK
jgi:spoIIIJ-associated protein